MAQGSMTVEERRAFLADVHVGILAIDRPGRGPLALPIWYLFRDGVVEITMEGTSLKAKLLRTAGRATLTVQTETAPYKYVSVEGRVELAPATGRNVEMATRYLGAELGEWYADNNPVGPETVVVRLTPESWITMDFAKVLG